MKTPIKVRMFVVFFYTNYEWCHSVRNLVIEANMTIIVSMIKINQKSYFEVQLKAATNTSSNFLINNELVAVNLI